MKNRIALSNVLILLILLIARPRSPFLFAAGLFFVILGQIIRLISSATIIKSKTLTTKGIYSVCRNPLYLGTLTITFGIMIQLSSSAVWNTAAVWLIALSAFPFIYSKTIKAEETFLLSVYGSEFEKYLASVPSLTPKISAIGEIFKRENYDSNAFARNKEYRGLAGTFLIELIILLKLYYAY